MITFILAWRISAIQRYLQTYAPTNIAIAWLRTRRGLKWAMTAAPVATPLYAWTASALVDVIERGGPPLARIRRDALHLERPQVRHQRTDHPSHPRPRDAKAAVTR